MENDSTFSGRIPTRIALALLESLRDVDTPADPVELAESDLPLNLQRRLGLSTVVVDQIRRYEQRASSDVSATEVASLFELIGRRPDASRIFVEAGQRIARADLKSRRGVAKLGGAILPQGLRERGALRRARRIARQISPEARIRLEHRPHALIVERGLPAVAAKDGTGCAVLAGALQYVFTEYRAGDYRIAHDRCEAHQGSECQWTLNAAGDLDEAGGEAPLVPDGAEPVVMERVANDPAPVANDPAPVASDPAPATGPRNGAAANGGDMATNGMGAAPDDGRQPASESRLPSPQSEPAAPG